MTTLVTGATGFLGSYVVARLVERTDEPIACLVRGPQPQERLDAALEPLLGRWDRARVRAIGSDLASAPAHVDAGALRAIVHSAADVRFDLPIAAARAANVEGVRALAEVAHAAPGLERFVHVSTAYVAGCHEGAFGEGDLDLGQRFRNTYEQSKLEAERLVRSAGLPLRVVRPSIVVGESATGWTGSFNVLYPPLRAFSRGLVERLPARPDAIVDVVPVDHVADVIEAALLGGGDDPRTLHAVAGDGALTAAGLAALAAGAMGREPPVLDPGWGDLPPGGLEVYAPYFTVRTRFTADRARALGLEPPPLADYLERLLAFAETARWGKRRPPRGELAPLG